jgi:hypothetical protein
VISSWKKLQKLQDLTVWVEPLFAKAKDWHGLRRFRLRTLEKVNAEALLIPAGLNIERLLAFGERGPRIEAQVAALRQLDPNRYKIFRARKHRQRCTWRPARVFNSLTPSRQLIIKAGALADLGS